MGNMRAIAVALLALAACGSDKAQPDAQIVIQDAPPPDMKIYEDAPPPMYDLSCLNDPAQTTAPDTITIAGTTSTLGMGGASPVPDTVVDVFKVGDATSVGTATSDSTGAFSIADIATGGTPIDGYVRGVGPAPEAQGDPVYRTTYMYPGTVVATNLSGVPVILITQATLDTISGFASVTQDDTTNGAVIVQVADCAGDPINGATLTIEQNSASVGDVFDLGALASQAAGTFFAFNVPDGDAQVKVSYDGKDFPVRTVHAYMGPGKGEPGSMSAVQVTPRN